MPFADYDSFEQCEREHSDKERPSAYCSEIHYQATGEYPGQKSVDDVFEDPNLYAKYALDAMEEIGKEPTNDHLDDMSMKAATLAGWDEYFGSPQ